MRKSFVLVILLLVVSVGGMSVAFSPYELAAYAAGPQTFELSYEFLKPYLDEHGLEVLGLDEE